MERRRVFMEYKGVHFEPCPLCGKEVYVDVMKKPTLIKEIEEDVLTFTLKEMPEYKVSIFCLNCGCALSRLFGYSISAAERYDAEKLTLESAAAFWNRRHVSDNTRERIFCE